MILVKILAPAFYARQDVRTPVRIALITLALTQMMNLAFIGWLKHSGLALSIGLAACANAAMLWHGLRKRGSYLPSAGWGIFFLRVVLALGVMGGVLWFAGGTDATWLNRNFGERLLNLGLLILAGASSYFAALWLLGFRIADFRRRAS